ncbi:MAG TPA: hypothetical protein ENK57_12715, partial [Polyangiaceae bacterium]|nr:hypothetical protein [Polyangiaceae bacterium]
MMRRSFAALSLALAVLVRPTPVAAQDEDGPDPETASEAKPTDDTGNAETPDAPPPEDDAD